MSKSIKETFIELIRAARKENADPVLWIMDYLADKGSHVCRSEAERLYEMHKAEADKEDEAEKLRELHRNAVDIELKIKTTDIPVVDGQLDFSAQDGFFADLREVHASIASLTLGDPS